MRYVFRRLEDHRISAYECRKHLPGGNRHREVERANESRDSNRTAVAHRPFIPELARDRLAKEAASFARRVISGVDSLLHVTARLGERLPHFARHRVGDFFFALGHDVADEAQYVAASRRRRTAPSGKASLRALDGALHIAPVGEWEFPDHVIAISRVVVLEVLVGFRSRPFSSDEVVE